MRPIRCEQADRHYCFIGIDDVLPGQKKNHPQDLRWEEHCSILWSCLITSDQRWARSCTAQSATFALRWSCIIEHDIRWWNSVLLTANLGDGSFFVQGSRSLRCPGTLFISHEHAIFLFSVFRMVQGEAKTPKIIGCCRAIFAFLHALKIGTFRGKWTLEWVFKTSQFFRLALYFLINSKLAFSFACFWTIPNENCKKILI